MADRPSPEEIILYEKDRRTKIAEAEHAGEAVRTGGARLLFVHPKAAGSRPFTERAQPPLDDEAREAFVERVVEIARVMAAGTFTARIDHHCADPFQRGDCRIHIVPAVSFA